MIKHTFYVKKERLEETKSFIRQIPSAKFIGNPTLIYNEYMFYISFENSEDASKMNILLNKYHEIDNPIIKESFWEKLYNFLLN